MGVFENVVVLGRSGADLETELLHLGQTGGADDPEQPAVEASPPAEPEAPAPDPDGGPAADAVDGDSQQPPPT